MATFKRNPRLGQQVTASTKMKAGRRLVAQEIADEAERIGRNVARSYTTDVEEEGDRTRVLANTEVLNAAAWIEFGTGSMPAHAPLRRGAEAAGAHTKQPE